MCNTLNNNDTIQISVKEYTDMVEKIRDLETYRKNINKYKNIFDSMTEGFAILKVVFNSSGKAVDCIIKECNSSAERQMEIINPQGKSILNLIPDVETDWFEVYSNVALTGEPMCFVKELRAVKKWFSVDLFKIDDDDGANVAVFFKDISDKVGIKNDLEKTIKIQDEVFANVSHELKTPLSVIFSTAQLLELYSKNHPLEAYKEKVDKSVGVIKQNCFRFIKLVNNIVDLSKMDSGFFKLNLKKDNIVEIVENIVQSVSGYIEDKGLIIVFDTDVEEKIIDCDPEKIERIMLNLISNAIKFSNKGSKIYVDIWDKGEFVEICVRDNGIGIDKKNMESIFKRFQQVDMTLCRNVEGSGIGLSLVKSIVDLHEGKISVESEIGKGSIFKVELPERIVRCPKNVKNKNSINDKSDKIEMINIEFSDIYQI